MNTNINQLPAGGFFWYEGKLYHKTWEAPHRQGYAAQAVSLEESGIKYDATHYIPVGAEVEYVHTPTRKWVITPV